MGAEVREREWGDLVARGRVIVGVAGVVLYVVGRMAIEAFYSTLQVTAEEIGLTGTIIIIRTGLYLLGFLFLTLMVAVALFGTIAILNRVKTFVDFRMPPLILIAIQIALTLALVGGVLGAWLPSTFSQPGWLRLFPGLDPLMLLFLNGNQLAVLASFTALTLFVILTPPVYRRAAMLDKSVSSKTPLIILQSVSLGVLLLSVAFLMTSRARYLAEQVMEGKVVRAGIFGGPFELVRVEWTEGAIPNGLQGEDIFMHLGQDKMVILYDYRCRRPLRVPVGKAILRVQNAPPSETECPS